MSINILHTSSRPSSDKEITVKLPLSKSMAARALLISAICGAEYIGSLPDCEDTHYLYKALKRYITPSEQKTAEPYYLGSGAAGLRFFTALAASTPGFQGEIHCSEQLRKRPLLPLINSLRQAGATIECPGYEGYPPLRITGKQLPGGEYNIDTTFSSQFLSALLLTAPMRESATTFSLSAQSISRPYIEMTLKMMQQAGAELSIIRAFNGNIEKIGVDNTSYSFVKTPDIETDWSAASYFYACSLVKGTFGYDSRIIIEKLTPPDQSIQGDAFCHDIFNFLGVKTEFHDNGRAEFHTDARIVKALQRSNIPIELNMGDTPDLVPAVSVALCLCGIRFRFNNVGHLRLKESDRLRALAAELEKIGYKAEIDADSFSWTGRYYPASEDATIQTYGDHRIAMAFAPAVFKYGSLAITDPNVVGKSFPDFWQQMKKVID